MWKENMKRTLALFLVLLGVLCTGLAGCGGGGGDDGTEQTQSQSNWDSMVWDQGQWQ